MKQLRIIDAPDQQFATVLNRRRVTFRFRYNVLTDRWSFNVAIDDLPVLHGRRVTTGIDLLDGLGFNIGKLFAIRTPAGDVPNYAALPQELIRLYHISDEEYAAEKAKFEEAA